MKEVTKYIAFDGEPFDDRAKCLAYEGSIAWRRLIGLDEAQVQAAIARTDEELADAIETIGVGIERTRRAAGDLKRQRPPKGLVAAPPPSTEDAKPLPLYLQRVVDMGHPIDRLKAVLAEQGGDIESMEDVKAALQLLEERTLMANVRQ